MQVKRDRNQFDIHKIILGQNSVNIWFLRQKNHAVFVVPHYLHAEKPTNQIQVGDPKVF